MSGCSHILKSCSPNLYQLLKKIAFHFHSSKKFHQLRINSFCHYDLRSSLWMTQLILINLLRKYLRRSELTVSNGSKTTKRNPSPSAFSNLSLPSHSKIKIYLWTASLKKLKKWTIMPLMSVLSLLIRYDHVRALLKAKNLSIIPITPSSIKISKLNSKKRQSHFI